MIKEALEEKMTKRELERSRRTETWSSKQQMAKASSAYEANIMTGTVAGSEMQWNE